MTNTISPVHFADPLAALQFPFGNEIPAAGQAVVVTPGVKWVRMALPFALNHINLWLIRDQHQGRDGWTLIDCCISKEESQAQWETLIQEALEGLPIVRVIVTHMHPDHVGLAYWLTERFDARLWMSAADYNAARVASQSTTGFGGKGAAAFFAKHGLVDPDAVAKIEARANYYPSMVPQVPRQFRRLMDAMEVEIGGQRWRCISGYGHAPEHMSLYCDALQVLISGDMLLPKISTNISVYDVEPECNPLPLFLDSLRKFLPLPKDTLVLPSHGLPFRGIHTRVAQLHEHHDARLEEVRQACAARATSAFDLLKILFHRELDLHQTTFAMGEAIAHLHALWFSGELQRDIGSDGVIRFSFTT